MTGVLIKRGDQDTDTHMPREEHVKTQGEGAVYMPKREASEETNPADTLTLDFQPLEL